MQARWLAWTHGRSAREVYAHSFPEVVMFHRQPLDSRRASVLRLGVLGLALMSLGAC